MGFNSPLKNRRWVYYLVAFLIVLGVSYFILTQGSGVANTIDAADSEANPGVFSGNKALDFTVLDSEGKSVSLSDFQGKPVFINFFATWCGPCKVEMPYMEKIWREYQEKGSDLVYLVVDVGESQSTVEKFFEQNFFMMPVFYDTNSKAFARYLFRGIPGSIFINRDGIITARYNESLKEDTIRTNIVNILQ